MALTTDQVISNITYLYNKYVPAASGRLADSLFLVDVALKSGMTAEAAYGEVLKFFPLDVGQYAAAFSGHPVGAAERLNPVGYSASIPATMVVDFYYPNASAGDRAALVNAVESGTLTQSALVDGIATVGKSNPAPSAGSIIDAGLHHDVSVPGVADPLPTANLPFNGIPAEGLNLLVALYVGAFSRAPEFAGIKYWVDQMAVKLAAGSTLNDAFHSIGVTMYSQGAGNGEGGTNLPTADYVALAYQNSLGRAPDAAGLDYWVKQISTNAIVRGEFLASFLKDAISNNGDSDYLKSKIGVAKFAAQEHVSGPNAKGIDLAGIVSGVSNYSDAQAKIASINTTYGTLTYGTAAIDKLSVTGDRSTFTITLNKDLAHYAATGSATANALVGIERIEFANGQAVALDIDGHAGQAFRLYEAALNRAPDEDGLGYWINQLDTGVSLTSVANQFVQSKEFGIQYGTDMPNQNFVNTLYHNILDRAPDAAGASFWVGQLDAGTASKAQVLENFSESTENQLMVSGTIHNGILFHEAIAA